MIIVPLAGEETEVPLLKDRKFPPLGVRRDPVSGEIGSLQGSLTRGRCPGRPSESGVDTWSPCPPNGPGRTDKETDKSVETTPLSRTKHLYRSGV